MKTISTLFCAGMLMSALCAGFVACNEPKDTEQKEKEGTEQKEEETEQKEERTEQKTDRKGEGTEIKPVQVSDEVSAFLDKYASSIYDGTPGCVMVNNMNELPKVDLNGAPINYPDIDFNSHTLIVGLYIAVHTGIYLVSQSIVVEHDAVTAHLILGVRKGEMDFAQVALPKCFWGIYPKIEAKAIDLNVTHEN